MKSISALALFSLAILSVCLGTQSERTRQRSGPIRSVPVAADIKRDNDFNCPEEFGYYPHPTDCTLYYVCVFGGALLESCTGGLMYSHELQTCDWPRNVGCDGTSAAAGEDVERIHEREREREPLPPPPPPRRTPPPPPPPRAQPNPIVTSRGQPKFNRDEYEKQQQLYAEVDDLPPVEEIESDRQQRVYRGQPSTIGQVQKDRDGYGSQAVNSRTINANIIPASLSQNSGKIGSFSFGTQLDERRTATATPAPQSYSEDKNNTETDYSVDRQSDIQTNEIDVNVVTEKTLLRKKRELTKKESEGIVLTNSTKVDNVSERNDGGLEYVELDSESEDEDEGSSLDDTERGKRQVRYLLQKGYKNPGKVWPNSKPIRFVDFQNFHYNHNSHHNNKHQPSYNGFNNNHYQDSTRKPIQTDNSLYSTANPFAVFQTQQNENGHSQRPFKPSLPDPSERLPHAPMNIATQIITKSPPISALQNNENPFSALAGGFYNNLQTHSFKDEQNHQNNNQNTQQIAYSGNRPNNQGSQQDSSLLPSTIVTGKPVKAPTSAYPRTKYRVSPSENISNQSHRVQNIPNQNDNIKQRPANSKPVSEEEEEYDDDDEDDDENENQSGEESNKEEDYFKHDFPEPPFEFTHPSNKYSNIENPFANPNFDFDAFLAKLRGDTSIGVTTAKPKFKYVQNNAVKIINSPESSTVNGLNSGVRSSTLHYNGMSTPRPFSVPTGPESATQMNQNNFNSVSSTEQSQKFQNIIQIPRDHQKLQQQLQQQSYNENVFSRPQQNAALYFDAVRPKLKPPNFKDDRQLPITYSFDRPISSTAKPFYDKGKGENHQLFSVTQRPFVVVSGTGSPIILSTPKTQFIMKPDKIISLQPHLYATGKPYLLSSIKPHNAYFAFKQSTQKPLTTLANEQLSALQHYWNNPSTEFYFHSTPKPSTTPDIPKLENLFAQAIRSSTQAPPKSKEPVSTTTKPILKRRPIPKPSPEMNDYYYDDEDEQYYEPPVKSKYMPSSEIRPQRPPMAQNYQEYDEYEDSEESSVNNKPMRTPFRRPTKYNPYNPESATKNHNDVSVVTKSPLKDSNKYGNGKVPIPVLVDYGTPAPNVIMRPEISNYEIIHHAARNRTMFFRKPSNSEKGPFTLRPPKYLNKTTLRPYTVRHRLAKPTTVKDLTTQSDDKKQTRGRMRHQNIVAQTKFTTPRDSHKQETRYTKTKYDDKTNSLEPTESVTPSSYSASPRPKMLYNGSQNYTPDQYDPYYAVYDEDGELYKDTDYVQQYNPASLRPAVQQTYRGTPPPARRPVDTYTPRPSQDDYDDALIHGQINNQNQNQNHYQAPIRHPTRGEGNELGYDHIPSSVKTTLYEATSISTTPSTTSTSTTQRQTIAPFTEAMTPSRYTLRSSTDENPILVPDSSSENPSDGSAFPVVPSTLLPMINISSLAKPFQKTDNSHRLQDTLTSTERPLTSGLPFHVTNNNLNRLPISVDEPQTTNDKKVISLTTGFSIRRNPNSSNNPYTLTVLTRPFDHFNQSKAVNTQLHYGRQANSNNHRSENNDAHEISIESQEDTNIDDKYKSSDTSMRRKDFSPEIVSEENDKPIYVRAHSKMVPNPRIKILMPTTTPATTKYYLKTVIKRPAPFGSNHDHKEESTENNINTDALIETGLQNARANGYLSSQLNNTGSTVSSKWYKYGQNTENWVKPTISPYRTLDNLRNEHDRNEETVPDVSTTTSSTTTEPTYTSTTPRGVIKEYVRTDGRSTSKPAYYSYRVLDEEIPDQTTEVFSGSVRNIIKAFFDNFSVTPKTKPAEQFRSTTPIISTTLQTVDKVVNIGYQKKPVKYIDDYPVRNNVKRLQIITESPVNRFVSPSMETIRFTERATQLPNNFSSTTSIFLPITDAPLFTNHETTPLVKENQRNEFEDLPTKHTYESRFHYLLQTNRPDSVNVQSEIPVDDSRKFQKIVNEKVSYNNLENEVTKLSNIDPIKTTTEPEWNQLISKYANEIATTTSTTKSTTVKTESTTSTTKSIPFPTRPSRVNPAIKLAATNPGGGRRSYQSSSKCSSDNSLQANPKCNEIKFQRPTSTRGRGSAHYTMNGSDGPQHQTVNRGTPPTRSRPTLKPSTSVVTNPQPVVDVYATPPRRPAPVYPQPTPDKTAAKCRKDVCLLPDCYCGGKDIPGELPVETVPQIVLLTFDDSVNDLNKGLYMDLFEKGRVNPNGCPISSTFYVSHEWTDYSQVQNLYSAGHEMASHTISHSFGEQFSQKKWNREVGGQREILAAYGGVKLEDVRGMRAPFLSVGGNKMFKMLYDSNFTYDSSLPVYENRPPSWPYTLDYKLFHDCMIPPCPTKSYPGVWEVPMVMWQDLNGGRCSMGDACANPPEAEGVYKMLLKNFDRHYTTNRAPFGLYYHAAWFTQPHHKEGFIMFLDFINQMSDVWIVTNWQALQWVRDPTPISRLNNFQPFQCNYQDRPKKCNNPKVCNLWHKSGVRYMRTCQPCPEVYPWTGKTGIKSSRIDNDIEE